MSLRFKILTAVVLVMLAVMTLLVIIIIHGMEQQDQESRMMRLTWVRQVVQDIFEGHTMVNNNHTELEEIVAPLAKARLIARYAYVDSHGRREFEHVQLDNDPTPPDLLRLALDENRIASRGTHVVVPISIAGIDRWGTLEIQLNVPAQLRYMPPDLFQKIFLTMCFGTLALLAVLYFLISAVVLKPVEKIARAADLLATGKYNVEVAFTDRADEIGRLIRAFRSMRTQLANYHQELQREIAAARVIIQKQERGLMVAQRLAATGTLAAGIAHEVNNPIGGMLNASLSLKKRHSTDERTVRYLDLIIEGLDRVRDTVSKVLQFTPRSTAVGPVHIERAIDSAVELARHRIKRHEIKLDWETPSGMPRVRGNLAELQQVVLNMLFNAIDAIDMASRKDGVISIRIEPLPEALRVRISDNGVGMSEEELSKAFDLFYTTKDPGKGTGLGLSIAHNIITGHGGQIELEGAKGRGATVVITLPLAEVEGSAPVGAPTADGNRAVSR